MQREGKHLLSHTAVYLVARGLPGVIAFAATALYTHLLSPEDYGRYALILGTAALLNALLFQWLRLSLVRYLPVYAESPGALKSTLLSATVAINVLLAAVAGVMALIPALHAWRTLLIPCWLVLATQAAFELCCEFSRASLRPWDAMWLQLTRAAAALLLGVGLIFVGLRWAAPLAGLAAGMALAVAWAWRRDWRDVGLKVDRAALRRVAQYGLPLSLTVALTVVISTSDRFLIAWRMNEAAAGLYSVAVDFASQTLTMLLMVVYMAAFPLAVRAWERAGREAATRQMRSNASLLLALGVPAAIGLAVLAPGFARCFLGAEFRPTAARIMPLVAFGSLLAGIKAYHFDAAFQFAHRTIHQVWIVLAAAVLNLALNWFAIPRYGINGAAGASVVAYAASIVMTVVFGRRYFAVPFPPGAVAQVTAGGLAMAAVLWPLRGHVAPVALAAQVLLGAAAYGMVLLSLNFLHLRDHLLERVLAGKADAVAEARLSRPAAVELVEGGAS